MTDEIQRELEIKYPFIAKARQKTEKRLLVTDIRKFLNPKNFYANINWNTQALLYNSPTSSYYCSQ